MKAHFKQKSAKELYQGLSVLSQETNESPQDFLVTVELETAGCFCVKC